MKKFGALIAVVFVLGVCVTNQSIVVAIEDPIGPMVNNQQAAIADPIGPMMSHPVVAIEDPIGPMPVTYRG